MGPFLIQLFAVVVVGGTALCLGLSFLNFRRRDSRHRAESVYRDWKAKIRDDFAGLNGLWNRAAVIRERTGLSTGRTAELTGDVIDKLDGLLLRKWGAEAVLRQVKRLIYPHSFRDELLNLFSTSRYEAAIGLMDSPAIGFDDRSGLATMLYSRPSFHGIMELLGSEDACEPFRESLSDLGRDCGTWETEIEAKLDRLEAGLGGLPRMISDSGQAIREISRRLDRLEDDETFIAVFPLDSLRQRLIPSVLALLDVCVERGEFDPVSAYESPARLAERQIRDGRALIECAEWIRERLFGGGGDEPGQPAVNRESLAQQLEECATILEELGSRAVLWPISSQLSLVRDRIELISLNLGRHGELEERIRRLGVEIETMGIRLATAQRRLADSVGVTVDSIFDENGSSPASRIELAAKAFSIGEEAVRRENLDVAERQLVIGEGLLEEAGDLIFSGECVARHGDTAWARLVSRLDILKGRFSNCRSRQADQGDNGGPIDPESDPLSHRQIESLLDQAEQLINTSQVTFRSGMLLVTGRQLQEAADKIFLADQKTGSLEKKLQQIDALGARSEQEHREISWRYRSMESRANDWRTSQDTFSRYRQLEAEIAGIGEKLAGGHSAIAEIAGEIESMDELTRNLDDQIRLDHQWHEMATNAVKGAARSLRLYRERTAGRDRENEDRSALESLQGQVEFNQAQLERQHLDWTEVFQAGVQLDIEASLLLGSLKRQTAASREAAEEIQAASRTIVSLFQRGRTDDFVDRHSALRLFGLALRSLSEGNYVRARINASAAGEEAWSAIRIGDFVSVRGEHAALFRRETPGGSHSGERASFLEELHLVPPAAPSWNRSLNDLPEKGEGRGKKGTGELIEEKEHNLRLRNERVAAIEQNARSLANRTAFPHKENGGAETTLEV